MRFSGKRITNWSCAFNSYRMMRKFRTRGIKRIELSSRIGAVIENENVWRRCMYVVHQRSLMFSTSPRSGLARDVSSSSRGYRKSIRVNLEGIMRIAANRFPRSCRKGENAGRKSMTKTRDAIRLAYMRGVSLLNGYANIFEDAGELYTNGIVSRTNKAKSISRFNWLLCKGTRW